MNIELKIKRITIAAEARGIRINENRLRRKLRRMDEKTKEKGPAERNAVLAKAADNASKQFWSLRSHRLWHVRPEARAMHLANAFLNGRTYWEIEPISRFPFFTKSFEDVWKGLMERVRYHVERHLPPGEKNKGIDDFIAWSEAGRDYASNLEMQKPARASARAGSLAAKNARRQAYERKKMAEDVVA